MNIFLPLSRVDTRPKKQNYRRLCAMSCMYVFVFDIQADAGRGKTTKKTMRLKDAPASPPPPHLSRILLLETRQQENSTHTRYKKETIPHDNNTCVLRTHVQQI